MARSKRFTKSEALEIGNQLYVSWGEVDLDQFRRGLNVEMEHYDTVDGSMLAIADIVLDHLEEHPQYYDYLEAMETRMRKGAKP